MRPELFANMAEVEAAHWWFRARLKIVLAVLQRLELPPQARILDVGAGTGGTTAALTRFGRVSALEVDPEARRFLPREALEAVLEAPLPDPAIPSDSYDLVTAFDVLEHIPDDLAVLREIHRLLAPGGHFVATVPAHPSLWTVHDDHHHHQRRYTRRSLRELAHGAGLELDSCSYWLSTLFPLFLAQRAWARLSPPDDARVQVPPGPLNAALMRIVAAERLWIASGRSAPMGASLLLVARKPR